MAAMAILRWRGTRIHLLAVGFTLAALLVFGWRWGLLGALPQPRTRVPAMVGAAGSPQAPWVSHSLAPRQTHQEEAVLHGEVEEALPGERFWHLDLKGGAPRVGVLERLMGMAARAGATGVLVEWEDAFPYTGHLANLSSRAAYTPAEVRRIAAAAHDAGLKMVPLMQSLGHLEYALKQPQWAALREAGSVAEACPSLPAAARLVTDALDQLLTAIPAPLVHIGADEVFTLGHCARCRARRITPLNLYLHHVLTIARHVKSRWGARVLVWDDMVRRAPLQALRSLAEVAEPVVWAYGPDVDRLVPPHVLRTYAAVFPRVWLAPAFKGASGPRAFMPDAARHAANTLAWMTTGRRVQRQAGLGVGGLVITGWSRYDHFAVLCELLPPATPSLVLTLLTAAHGSLTPAALRDAHALLECPPHVTLEPAVDPHLWAARDCAFTGANAAAMLHRYARLREEVEAVRHESQEHGGWLTAYNRRHNFSSPARVRQATASLGSLSASLRGLYKEARAVLRQYHDHHTTAEWLEQHLDPLNTTLTTLNAAAATLTAINTWPRRPLDYHQHQHDDYNDYTNDDATIATH